MVAGRSRERSGAICSNRQKRGRKPQGFRPQSLPSYVRRGRVAAGGVRVPAPGAGSTAGFAAGSVTASPIGSTTGSECGVTAVSDSVPTLASGTTGVVAGVTSERS